MKIKQFKKPLLYLLGLVCILILNCNNATKAAATKDNNDNKQEFDFEEPDIHKYGKLLGVYTLVYSSLNEHNYNIKNIISIMKNSGYINEQTINDIAGYIIISLRPHRSEGNDIKILASFKDFKAQGIIIKQDYYYFNDALVRDLGVAYKAQELNYKGKFKVAAIPYTLIDQNRRENKANLANIITKDSKVKFSSIFTDVRTNIATYNKNIAKQTNLWIVVALSVEDLKLHIVGEQYYKQNKKLEKFLEDLINILKWALKE